MLPEEWRRTVAGRPSGRLAEAVRSSASFLLPNTALSLSFRLVRRLVFLVSGADPDSACQHTHRLVWYRQETSMYTIFGTALHSHKGFGPAAAF